MVSSSNFLQEHFECYHIADIESGLGLKRKQMVAMALLIGSDHDLHGVLVLVLRLHFDLCSYLMKIAF
jgi:hypothetical protein